jgi:hypothetical protein
MPFADLVRENAQLKVENALLEDKANAILIENRDLHEEAKQLREQQVNLQDRVRRSGVLHELYESLSAMSDGICFGLQIQTYHSILLQMDQLQQSSEEEAARMQKLLDDLKVAVSETMNNFTTGDCSAIDFKERMNNLGIELDCTVEQLGDIQASQPARCAAQIIAFVLGAGRLVNCIVAVKVRAFFLFIFVRRPIVYTRVQHVQHRSLDQRCLPRFLEIIVCLHPRYA